jgi:hypothetical protein
MLLNWFECLICWIICKWVCHSQKSAQVWKRISKRRKFLWKESVSSRKFSKWGKFPFKETYFFKNGTYLHMLSYMIIESLSKEWACMWWNHIFKESFKTFGLRIKEALYQAKMECTALKLRLCEGVVMLCESKS